jgi:hypothetical protein
MSLSCRCPGKTNDWMAYLRSTMSTQIDNLPALYYIVGDTAYVNSEHLLAPYPGTNLNQREDAYNLYSSQLRIRIEQAFALLVGWWGIFWCPLRVPRGCIRQLEETKLAGLAETRETWLVCWMVDC